MPHRSRPISALPEAALRDFCYRPNAYVSNKGVVMDWLFFGRGIGYDKVFDNGDRRVYV
jgi:hypothetical protein